MNFMDILMASHIRLEKVGLLDDIYDAISSMDLSAAVIGVLQGMSIVRSMPCIPKTEKNAFRSCMIRTEGNEHYTSKHYLKALLCYNKALLFAPEGSIERVQAYSNRSALLLKLNAYTASLVDMETCLTLGCTGDLLYKINKRRKECIVKVGGEIIKNYQRLNGFTMDFFQFYVRKHPTIPCLSADVDIVTLSGERKVAAAKDIMVGSVVALETAFTTFSPDDKSSVSCYYCQKMSFNLIPCNNCCFALFCSPECQELCIQEYHDIECQIMDVLETLNIGFKFRLTIKTVLKLIKKCNSWSKLIEESRNIGASRLSSSSVGQIYNVENYSSILCFKEDRQIIHGFMYNCCYMFAIVLNSLEDISGFFPAPPIDMEAKKCFAELCMRLGTMCDMIEINNTAENVLEQQVRCGDAPTHFGWFSLTSKLKHSCDPNVVVIGLNNKVALVAVKPIKKMTEITISYIDHYYDRTYGQRRASNIYHHTLKVCCCRVCKDSWGENFFKKSLTPQQKKIIRDLEKSKRKSGYRLKDEQYFKENCYALTNLEDLANTKEHAEIFGEFRTQLGLFQYAVTLNALL